jgi:hypothetical protein
MKLKSVYLLAAGTLLVELVIAGGLVDLPSKGGVPNGRETADLPG